MPIHNKNDYIKPGQVISLKTALREITDDPKAWTYILSAIVDRDLDELEELTRAEWKYMRNKIYPNWTVEDWTPWDRKSEFYIRCCNLYEDYLEEEVGQSRLF